MRHVPLAIAIVIGLLAGHAGADEFLGVPIPSDGRVTDRTETSVVFKVPRGHDDILAFYRDHLRENPDIKYRDWEDVTYIEDDGNSPWHSITIEKAQTGEITVVIKKDSWTWILGTLVLRYIGVFVVLVLLWGGMAAAGGVISRVVGGVEQKAQARR